MNSPTLGFQFNFSRALHWGKALVFSQSGTLLTTGAFIFGSYALLYFLSLLGGASEFPQGWLFTALTFAGFIAPSQGFRDLHRPQKAQFWVLLPASQGEKFLVTVLLTTFGTLGAVLVGFFISDLLLRGIFTLFTGNSHVPLDFFDPDLWRYLGVLLVLAPLLLYGSLRFRRLALLKTLLSVVLGVLILGALATAFAWALFQGVEREFLSGGLNFTPWSGLSWIGELFFYILVPLFFLVVGYLRLTESEIKSGVS